MRTDCIIIGPIPSLMLKEIKKYISETVNEEFYKNNPDNITNAKFYSINNDTGYTGVHFCHSHHIAGWDKKCWNILGVYNFTQFEKFKQTIYKTFIKK